MSNSKKTDWKGKYQKLEGRLSEIEEYKKLESRISEIQGHQEETKKFNSKIIGIERIHLWVAVILVLITGVQGYILFQQNDLFESQNNLVTNQNKRLDQQTYLQEAERRGSLVHLFNNVLDAIDREIRDDIGLKGKRDLSPQLISRIISLSHALKPYRYLDGDELVSRPTSPERGQLFLSLLYLDLEENTLSKLFKDGNFTYSDLNHARFEGFKIPPVRLDNSDLSNTFFKDCELIKTQLNSVIFENSSIHNVDFDNLQIMHSNLTNLNWYVATMKNTVIYNSNLANAKIFPVFCFNNSIHQNYVDGLVIYRNLFENFNIKTKYQTIDTISNINFRVNIEMFSFEKQSLPKRTYDVNLKSESETIQKHDIYKIEAISE